MISMPELAQATLLVMSASASLIWIGTARRHHDEPLQPALFCVQLAFALATGAGACAVAHLGFGLETQEAHRWLLQATLLLGFPLIAAVTLALGRRWTWSRPNWGRLVIGLCAFFELARQLGWSQPYALGLGVSSALLVVYAGLLCWPARLQFLAGALGGLLMFAALPLSDQPLANYQTPCLALACLPLAWLVLKLSQNAETAASVSE